MNNLGQDIRYALRRMRKSPVFAAVAIITLAVSIGANTAIFTVINHIFVNPLPVRDPEHLVSLYTTEEGFQLGPFTYLPVSRPNAEDVVRTVPALSGVALYAFARTGVSMTINGQPNKLNADVVSGNYFDVLGVPAALGRTFHADEERDGSAPVIVLSYALWQSKFAGNPDVVGTNVLMNRQSFTIIGVAPRGFEGPTILGGPDLWVTMATHDLLFTGIQKIAFNERRFLGFWAFARLNQGATLEQAREQLRTLTATLESTYPEDNKKRKLVALPLLETTVHPNFRDLMSRGGWLLMLIVGLVLLIACSTIANLLLSRAASRKREVAIRLAVGASRSRVIAQLLTEAVVLALAGGVLGLGLAVIGRNLIWRFRPPFLLESNLELPLDTRVLLFALGITLLTGFIFGLAPALRASRPDLVSELKGRGGEEMISGRRFGLANIIIVGQVTFSLVALVTAALFLVSLNRAHQLDAGFDTNNLGMLSFDLGSLKYEPARVKEFERRALDLARTTPGVQSAALTDGVPLLNPGFARTIFPEGKDPNDRQSILFAQASSVSSEYLKTMGISLLRGNGWTDSLQPTSPRIAVINSAAANRIWPNEDPLGKRFKFFGDQDWVQVVGVARDSKYITLSEDPSPYVYLPLEQNPSPTLSLMFRSSVPIPAVLNSMRGRVQALDPDLPLTNVWPVEHVVSQSLWGPNFAATLLGIFALIALLLCVVGIYGVVAYSVERRVREIGIRMALGARPRDIITMVVAQNGLNLAIGIALGLIAAFMLARVIVSLLYGVSVINPTMYLLTALFLAAAGVLASYIPARRAAKVDPTNALRDG